MRFLRSTVYGEWFEIPFPETMEDALELAGDEEGLVNLVGMAVSHRLNSVVRCRLNRGQSLEEIDETIAEWTYSPLGPRREEI